MALNPRVRILSGSAIVSRVTGFTTCDQKEGKLSVRD